MNTKQHGYLDTSVSAPSYAKSVALWALEKSRQNEEGSYYANITAIVFSLFMFEGVIHFIGEKVVVGWTEKPQAPSKLKAPERRTLKDRHKLVRDQIRVDFNDELFSKANSIIDNYQKFRDSFAHPKIIKEKLILKEYDSDNIPEINLEKEISSNKIEQNVKKLIEYCDYLLKKAAIYIRNIFENDCLSAAKKHQNLKDYTTHISELETLLGALSFSIGRLPYEPK